MEVVVDKDESLKITISCGVKCVDLRREVIRIWKKP